MSTFRIQEILIGQKENSKYLNNLEKDNPIKKIAPRLYTSNLEEAAPIIVRRNWYRILSELYPKALLSHRSALERLLIKQFNIFLTYSYTDLIELPGMTIHCLEGPGPLADDEFFFGNLRASGLARAYLENLQSSRGNYEEAETLSREKLEERMELFLRVKGEAALNSIRDKAKEIAPLLGMQKEYKLLNHRAGLKRFHPGCAML